MRPGWNVTIRHLWKLKPDPINLLRWEPLAGYIQMNLLQQASHWPTCLPPRLGFFSLTLCRSLSLSAGLLERLVTSISVWPSLRHNLSLRFVLSFLSLPLSLSLSPSAGLLARSALNPERLLCSINEGKSWKSKAETDKRRGGRARSWDVKEWDRKMDWMQGRVDGLSDDEQNFSPCSCSLSLFSSRLCVLFHRHAQIEPPLYSWIELNWKAKGKRTGEDKEQRKAVTGMPSRINKVGRSADLGWFFFPPESSHLGDFKARPVINKWAVGLLDLFKECLGSVTTSQDTLKEGGAHEVALGAFSVSI